MNDTKWLEIFRSFYYGVECSDDENVRSTEILWTTRSTNGYVYGDSSWTHFAASGDFKTIDWLKIELTPQNRALVLSVLRKIHVPGTVFDDCVYVYGYRTDVDYI